MCFPPGEGVRGDFPVVSEGILAMRTVVRSAAVMRLVLLVLALGYVVGCGGDSGSGPGGEEQPTVLSISLGASSAMPGESVALSGIPAEMDIAGIHATVEADGAGSGSPGSGESVAVSTTTIVYRDATGAAMLLVPLDPSDMIGGGDVSIALAGPNVTSNTVALTIEPLPAATFAMSDVVDDLQAVLTTWLDAQGTTREALRAMDPASMPTRLYPLFVAQHVLDSPDNPNSLRATVDGAVPYFNNETIDFDVADRLLSTTGITSFLSEESDSLTSAAPFYAFDAAVGPQRAPRRAPSSCILPGDYGIDDAPSLDRAMWLARFAIKRLSGASGKVVGDTGKVVGVLGLFPQLKAQATVVGGALFVYQAINQAAGNLLPSEFVNSASRITFADDQTVYNEDDLGGYWTKFSVTAKSRGWKLDKFILDSIMELAKLEGAGGLTTVFPSLGEFGEELTGYIVSEGVALLIDQTAGQGSDALEVCPNAWENIDVSDPAYCQAEIVLGTSFEMESHTFFGTRGIGVSEIRLSTISSQDNFGGAPPALKQEQLEVLGIEVDVDPPEVTMGAGATQSFSATVHNASDDQVAWTLPAGFQQVDLQNFGKTIVVKAPASGFDGPVTLQARSQANTGAREGRVDSDPRDGFALILSEKDAKIVVSPNGICIHPGEQTEFFADVTGPMDSTVTWSASAGSFSGNIYTAPGSNVPEVTITATSVAIDTLKGTATIEVGDCSCSWDADVSGAVSGSYHGTQALWASSALSDIALHPSATDDYPSIHIGFYGEITGEGVYEANISSIIFSNGDEAYIATDLPDEGIAPPTLTISSIDGTQMQGTVVGQLARPEGTDPVVWSVINVNVTFRAENRFSSAPCTQAQ